MVGHVAGRNVRAVGPVAVKADQLIPVIRQTGTGRAMIDGAESHIHREKVWIR